MTIEQKCENWEDHNWKIKFYANKKPCTNKKGDKFLFECSICKEQRYFPKNNK